MHFATPDAILNRLESGFNANSAELKSVEKKLSDHVQSGREFTTAHLAVSVSNSQWDSIEKTLNHIERLSAEIDETPQGRHHQKDIEYALQTWEALQEEISKMEVLLAGLRDQISGLDRTERQEWNTLAQTFEEELETLFACAKTLRIRLELQDGRSPEEVDRFISDVLTELRERPRPAGVNAADYELDYLKSAIEIAHEKHESLGMRIRKSV